MCFLCKSPNRFFVNQSLWFHEYDSHKSIFDVFLNVLVSNVNVLCFLSSCRVFCHEYCSNLVNPDDDGSLDFDAHRFDDLSNELDLLWLLR